ncbi:MAG: hypothetical protein ABR583_03705 [Gaiellaceae bacterium]
MAALAPVSVSQAATPQDVVVSRDPADWTPHVLDGQVRALAQVGSKIVSAGTFSQVQEPGGAVLARQNIFAFDAATGKIDTLFVPTVNGPVEDVVAGFDGSVLVAGSFTSVNGLARAGLVALNLATGQTVSTFAAKPNGPVHEVALSGTRLFFGGTFSAVNGQVRSKFATVNAVTGALDANVNFTFAEQRTTSQTSAALAVSDLAVSPDGSRLVVAGSFGKVNGQPRHQVAVLDISQAPAALANWSTDRYQPACAPKWPVYVRDVDFHPDGGWFAIVTAGGYAAGSLCDTAARWEIGVAGSGLQPTWVDHTGGDTLHSVEVTRPAVYVGGHQRWHNNPFAADFAGPGAVSREGIAALDPVNGLPLSWNPGRSRGVGVEAFLVTASGLWVGSDTTRLGWEYHARLGFFPALGGTTPPRPTTGTLPGTLYKVGQSSTLTRQSFDGTTVGPSSTVTTAPAAWAYARGAFLVSGRLYTGWADGKLYGRSFDGTTLGPASAVNLLGLDTYNFPVTRLTGMFIDTERSRVYYTLLDDSNLRYRGFTLESQILGAETFVANSGGIDWKTVRGMTLASGRVYYGDAKGKFRSIGFAGGKPSAGTGSLISAAGDWRSNGLFVR